jgi:hypothetical protein
VLYLDHLNSLGLERVGKIKRSTVDDTVINWIQYFFCARCENYIGIPPQHSADCFLPYQPTSNNAFSYVAVLIESIHGLQFCQYFKEPLWDLRLKTYILPYLNFCGNLIASDNGSVGIPLMSSEFGRSNLRDIAECHLRAIESRFEAMAHWVSSPRTIDSKSILDISLRRSPRMWCLEIRVILNRDDSYIIFAIFLCGILCLKDLREMNCPSQGFAADIGCVERTLTEASVRVEESE